MPNAHSFAEDVLHLLFLAERPCSTRRLWNFLLQVQTGPGRPAFDAALYRLQRGRLIVRSAGEGGRGGPWTLSPLGRTQVELPPRSREAPVAPEGLMYFVTYDVPVELKNKRDVFRLRLRGQGWRRLHQSLWVADRDIRADAQVTAEELGIGGCVFVGTGAVATPFRRDGAPAEGPQALRALQALAAGPTVEFAGAFRGWVDATRALRSGACVAWMDDGTRGVWWSVVAMLRRSVADGEGREAGTVQRGDGGEEEPAGQE